MTRTIIIAGAGPAGLSLARGLADSAHRVVLVDPQPAAVLADPPPDGREIALTLRSAAILDAWDIWPLIEQGEAYPLRQARVRNGASPFALAIGPERGDALGHMVPNHCIRRALFAAVAAQPNVTLLGGRRVVDASTARGVAVTLDDGAVLTGDLLVAADSRFSGVRDLLGVPAAINRLGHTMLVCRIGHTAPHADTATEWFDHGRTIALLPLGPGQSSLVITLPAAEAERLGKLDAAPQAALFARWLAGSLGEIALLTPPVPYPLAMTYARRFCTRRAVLIGDSAVGMHPVTAHGFNFGLLGASRLARLLAPARDPGDPLLLRRYAVQHRLATRPLYAATLNLVRLFTDDRLPARPLRHAVLRLGALPPVRRAMARLLSAAEPA